MRSGKKALTDSEVRALTPGPRRVVHSLGNSLLLVVEGVKKGGSKRFVGRYRFPPGRDGKQKELALGTYGKGARNLTLKQAKDLWEKERVWMLEHPGEDPNDRKKKERLQLLNPDGQHTVEDAAEGYLQFLKQQGRKEGTIKDYRNMLWNQVLPALGPSTPLKDLNWSAGGRQAVVALKESVANRGAAYQSEKVLMVLRGVFSYAIDRAWMETPNPALKTATIDSGHKSKQNPALKWEQVPQFFEDLDSKSGELVLQLALKVLAMTFLRVGSLVPARWEELDYESKVWTIPAERMKSGKEHKVPLTCQLIDAFEELRKFNGHQEFVFFSPRGRKTPHLNPQSLNQHLIHIGYKGVTTAHGFRATALTAGIEVLGFPTEVVRRQMAHVVGDKVQQAYDRSEFMIERTKFMTAWCDSLVEAGLKI